MAAKKDDSMVTVYATTLVHEANATYQMGEPIETSPARAEKLINSGICAAEPPAPAALAPSPQDVEDKMMRGKLLGK